MNKITIAALTLLTFFAAAAPQRGQWDQVFRTGGTRAICEVFLVRFMASACLCRKVLRDPSLYESPPGFIPRTTLY